jgi:hypothetical protein
LERWGEWQFARTVSGGVIFSKLWVEANYHSQGAIEILFFGSIGGSLLLDGGVGINKALLIVD